MFIKTTQTLVPCSRSPAVPSSHFPGSSSARSFPKKKKKKRGKENFLCRRLPGKLLCRVGWSRVEYELYPNMVLMTEQADRPVTPLPAPEQLPNRDSRGNR